MCWFLDRNYDDCLFEVQDGRVRRLIRKEEGLALIDIADEGEALRVEVLEGRLSVPQAKAYVQGWFDLERNLEPFYSNLEKDHRLRFMQEDFYGLRMARIPDLYEALCWCIIGQQINLPFAYLIKRRLVEAFGDQVDHQGKTYYCFPRPDQMESATPEQLREMQFSRQKIRYILELTEAFQRGDLSQKTLAQADPDERKRVLLEQKGVGEWTAHYVLMKTFGDVAYVPYGDVGLFQALQNLGVIKDRKEDRKIRDFFEPFTGWGGYLTLYLWRTLSHPKPNG